jgi:inner membrane protein COX18
MLKLNKLLAIRHACFQAYTNEPLLCSHQKRLQSTISDNVNEASREFLVPTMRPLFEQQISVFNKSPVVHSVEDALTAVHDWLPCEWWLCITLATLTMRLCVRLPIAIYQQKNSAHILNLQPEIKKRVESEILSLRLSSKDPNYSKLIKKIVIKFFFWDFVSKFILKSLFNQKTTTTREKIYEREGRRPHMTAVASCLQLPFWIALTVGLRDLALGINGNIVQATEMQTEGLFWFQNLTQADPYFILPAVTMVISLLNLKVENVWYE